MARIAWRCGGIRRLRRGLRESRGQANRSNTSEKCGG